MFLLALLALLPYLVGHTEPKILRLVVSEVFYSTSYPKLNYSSWHSTDNNFWSWHTLQWKQLEHFFFLTSPRLWSTFPPHLSNPGYRHNCYCFCPCHLYNNTGYEWCPPVNNLFTKEQDPVVESHHTHCPHWPGQSSTRDLPPLPGRGAIHLSRGKALIALIVPAPSDQQHLNKLSSSHSSPYSKSTKLNLTYLRDEWGDRCYFHCATHPPPTHPGNFSGANPGPKPIQIDF